ncbi:phenylalanine--tRNA ligase subunit beta [Candidatus Gracilibacteria bacterium]|nr:phenylalanine--tRNA ligase subunit beta [Candidatus Gracilibacteria bacterium]
MKISYNWLLNFLPGCKVSPEEIGEKLTLHTAELEEIVSVRKGFEKVYMGKFLEKRAHKNSEKLFVGIFDLGQRLGKKQIVYGQVHIITPGEILPIAIDGAVLNSGIVVKNVEIRGEKSEGMVCDNKDLGFSFGGLLYSQESSQIGRSLPECYKELNDELFDIDNKSLTHRPDLMGVRGFSREVSAIFETKLMLPEPIVSVPKKEKVEVEIRTDKCRRFCAIRLSGVSVEDSEFSTQVRLENLGVRAISNLVDITNLMLLEFGQPMHVFDAAKISGKIIVRQAKKGETIVALDGNEYKLQKEDIVIADEEKVLSIGGIMGGEETSINSLTKEIIFECANFDPTTIRKTSQRLGIRTESSMRYEKSLDAQICKRVILAAAEKTLNSYAKAQIISGLTDEYPIKAEEKTILLDPELIRKKSGLVIVDQKIKELLESINFRVSTNEEETGKTLFQVVVPSGRATKDINISEDLIEEVVRLYGFFRLKSQMPVLSAIPPRKNYLREMEWETKEHLASRGFLEVYNYSFVNESDEVFTGFDHYVKIANPLSLEHTQLRKTLISNLVKNLESELRTHGEINLFEFGHVCEKVMGQVLPKEQQHIAIFSAEIGGDENQKFYALKKEVEILFSHFGIAEQITFKPLEADELRPYIHPSKSANILHKGKKIGEIAVLHPQFLPLKNSQIVFAELEAEKMLAIIRETERKYQRLSSFPSVYRDLSVVLGEKIFIADIERIMQSASPVLRRIELFDEYKDAKKLGVGVKNFAFHLEFRSAEKTLEEQEIDSNFNGIVQALENEFGAKLRMEFDKGC